MAKKEKPQSKNSYNSLKELQSALNTEFGDGTVLFGRPKAAKVEVIPTGIMSLDIALGCGGLPEGRIMEISGPESGGKTTSCLNMIAACQQWYIEHKKRNGVAAFIDVEHAFDQVWARNIGVNLDRLLFTQPNSGDEVFSLIERYADSGLIDLIVVDSVAGLMTKAELEGDMDTNDIGGVARLMSKGLRRITGKCSKPGTTVIFINQLREKIGISFGSPEITTGGRALKFYASVRAEVRRVGPIKENEEVVGFRTKFKVTKNKVAPPFREAEFDIRFGKPCYGIDTHSALFDAAVSSKVIVAKGSHYKLLLNGEEKALGNGAATAVATIRSNPDIFNSLASVVYAKFKLSMQEQEQEVSEDGLDDPILDGEPQL